MTTTILTLCWGYVWPLCSHIDVFEYPSWEACDRERTVLMASPRKPDRATCTPKIGTPK